MEETGRRIIEAYMIAYFVDVLIVENVWHTLRLISDFWIKYLRCYYMLKIHVYFRKCSIVVTILHTLRVYYMTDLKLFFIYD